MKKSLFLLPLFLIYNIALSFNHPEINWKSVNTNHFTIHYYDKTEPALYATWKIAEEVYENLSRFYDYSSPQKIHIALADYDDYSNGFANWTNSSIMIWITDARFDFRNNNVWLRNVISHELTHIISLSKKSKFQLLDFNLAAEYSSPGVQINLAEPFAFTRFWPEWCAEGAAQIGSEENGGDCFDKKREMLLLDAASCKKLLSLDEMSHFNHNSVRSELVYNQGYSFLKFIESKVGRAAIVNIFNNQRKTELTLNDFNSLFIDYTGFNLNELYNKWQDSIRIVAKQKEASFQQYGKTVWDKGTFNYFPKVSNNKKWWGWLSSDKDDFGRTDLIIAPYGSTENIIRIKWALSLWDFSYDSKYVYFIKQREISNHGSFYNDLYIFDLEKRKTIRLTKGARIYDIAVCPDNKTLICIKFESGVYSIVKTDLMAKEWETIVKGNLGEPFIGLSVSKQKFPAENMFVPKKDSSLTDSNGQDFSDSNFLSPNSSLNNNSKADSENNNKTLEYKIATTRIINQKQRLCIVGISSKSISIIGPDSFNIEYPFWSENNRIYFSADFSDFFNIYSIDLETNKIIQHTNSCFGVFQPFLDTYNNQILCCQFKNQHFSVVTYTPLEKEFNISQNNTCSFYAIPKPKGEVSVKSRPYEKKLLKPLWEAGAFFSLKDQNQSFIDAFKNNNISSWSDTAEMTAQVMAIMSRTDALGKKELDISFTGAFYHSGIEKTDSSWKDTLNSGIYHLPKSNFNLIEYNFNKQNKNKLFLNSLKNIRCLQNDVNAVNQTTPVSDSISPVNIKWIPVLIPAIGLQNNFNEISFSFAAQAILLQMIPVYLIGTSNAMWQISRDLYLACSPELIVNTLLLESYSISFPMGIIFYTYDYINQDISYNNSGITQIQFSFTPEFFATIDSTNPDIPQVKRHHSLSYEFDFSHGFPINRYSSFILRLNNLYTKFSSNNFIDPYRLLKGISDEFLKIDAGGSFVFPILRQINKGALYADALYGEFSYDFMFYSNTTKFTRYSLETFFNPKLKNSHIYPQHIISLGTRLGFFKSYAFYRTLSAKLFWDIINTNAGFSLNIGF